MSLCQLVALLDVTRAYSSSVANELHPNMPCASPPNQGASPMAAKCKTNPRRTKHNRASFGQKLDRRPSQPTVERKISLPDGSTLAIAHVNGVYMLGRFKGQRPLDARPELFNGRNGQTRAYLAASAQVGYTVLPMRQRS